MPHGFPAEMETGLFPHFCASGSVAVGFVGPCAAQRANGSKDLPLVWVLSTGGTISGKGASSTSLTEYKAGSLLGEELVKAVPEIQQYARVRVEQIVNIGSPDITIENWITLAKRINRIFADDAKVAVWSSRMGLIRSRKPRTSSI
jgi:L-asparaginase/Glu-tRNA(Gln) amidotransferase subunit D